MPLGDVAPLIEWRDSTNPLQERWNIVRLWVEMAGQTPWLSPSIPFPELSDQPHYEVRSAVIPYSEGVEVFHRHTYADDRVDIIAVR